jgi:lipopolysaccharide/colanic/teichoic acid biosynthesis glycosyltransferase
MYGDEILIGKLPPSPEGPGGRSVRAYLRYLERANGLTGLGQVRGYDGLSARRNARFVPLDARWQR